MQNECKIYDLSKNRNRIRTKFCDKKKMTDTAAIFTFHIINFWSLYKTLENLMTSNDQVNSAFLV